MRGQASAFLGDRATSQAVFAAVAVIAIVTTREPAIVLAPQLWAEDGSVFIPGATSSGWDSVFHTYAGYLHLLPRMVAAFLVPLVPLEQLPLALNISALFLTGVAASLVALARVAVPHRWLYAVAMVLVPHGGEVFGTITNLQWYGALLLFLLVIQSPAQDWRAATKDAGIALVFGLTGPFSLLVLPLILGKAFIVRPTGHDLPAIAILCAAAIATIVAMIGSSGTTYLNQYLASPGIAAGAVVIVVLSSWIGQSIHLAAAPAINLISGIVFGIAVLIILRPALGWLHSRRTVALAAGASLLYALALLLTPALRVEPVGLFMVQARGDGERYLFAPHVLLLWFLIYLAQNADFRSKRGAAVVLSFIALSVAIEFQAKPVPDYDWPSQAAKIGPEMAEARIPPNWQVQLCRYPC
jgi:hypothetical protein